MAEKPILFNTKMVRAIMDGLKTQTRRPVKDMPLYEPYFEVDEGIAFVCDEDGEWHPAEAYCKVQPGDVLWVRETWQQLYDHRGWRYEYRADHNDDEPVRLDGMYVAWRPSIHMPRKAARLFLRVTNVSIERLQDIDAEAIRSEGLTSAAVHCGDMEIAVKEWANLWNSTIKPADLTRYGWDANPWIWVIEFERLEEYP